MKERDDFLQEFMRIFKTASEAGIRNVLRPNKTDQPFNSQKEMREFLSRCHRGFQKSQDRVVQLLAEIEEDLNLDDNEKEYRQMLLRKVTDHIGWSILQNNSYLARRLAIHSTVPSVNIRTVQEALISANDMNSESRLTFALLADLTTFIHVADILRVDFRGKLPTISLHELKTGRVNQLLLEQLQDYEPSKDSLIKLEQDESIDQKYKPQAKRMLRQQIRLAQLDEILRNDKGIDLNLDMPFITSKEAYAEETYDEFVYEICGRAIASGFGGGSVNRCVHIGAGYSSDIEEAFERARVSLSMVLAQNSKSASEDYNNVLNEVTAIVGDERYKFINPIRNNLHSVAARPFILWQLGKEYLAHLIAEKLCLLIAFDVVGFIWMGRNEGIEIKFASRKRTTQAAQQTGSAQMTTWKGRALEYTVRDTSLLVYSGLLSRFINDLTTPLPFLRFTKENIESLNK